MRSLEKVLRQNWETEYYCEPWMEWYEAQYYLKQTLSDTREFLQDSRVRFDDALELMSVDSLRSKAPTIVRTDRLHLLLTNWVQRLENGTYLDCRPIDDRKVAAKTALYQITRHATVLHFLLLQLEDRNELKDRKSLDRLIVKGDINLKDIDLSTILAPEEDKDLLSEKYILWRAQVLRQEATDRVTVTVTVHDKPSESEASKTMETAVPGCLSCFKTETVDSLTIAKKAKISSYDDDAVVMETKIKSCKKDKQKRKPWSSFRRAIFSVFRLK